MSDYLKSTNFATKDALPSGNAGKIVKGTEIDNEFNNIADAIESKADLLNPVFSGLLTTDTLTTGGAANIGGTLAVAGAFSAAADAQFTGTGRVKVPTGTTAQRPASPSTGSLRFNTTLGFLENYNGTEWRLVAPDPTPAQVSNQINTSTGYFQVPVGTIAQRPASPAEGLVRYNSESDIYEGYINGNWHKFLTTNQGSYTVTYLAVGGGGGGNGGIAEGGGSARDGGGGAGKVIESTTSVTPGTSVITVTIGAGGGQATDGTASTLTGIASATGGSHGEQSGGTSGNGYSGGATATGETNAGGGGGGAGGVGSNALNISSIMYGGGGGGGVASSITGTSATFGGGGGGGAYNTGGGGGTGGGGTGNSTGVAATNGSTNTGGGGGGAWAATGGNGGSGIVFLSIPTVNYTGTHTGSPTVTTTGSNTVLRYASSGTYTC